MTLRERLTYELSYLKEKVNILTVALWASAGLAIHLGPTHWFSGVNHTAWLLYVIVTVFITVILLILLVGMWYVLGKAVQAKSKVNVKIDSAALQKIRNIRVLSIVVSVINICLMYRFGYDIMGSILMTTTIIALCSIVAYRKTLDRIMMLKLQGVIGS